MPTAYWDFYQRYGHTDSMSGEPDVATAIACIHCGSIHVLEGRRMCGPCAAKAEEHRAWMDVKYYNERCCTPEYRAKRKAYRETHREEIRAKRREHFEAHKDEYREWWRAYYEEHKERIIEWNKAYYEANHEERKAYHRAYYEAHREEINARRRERYAREKAEMEGR